MADPRENAGAAVKEREATKQQEPTQYRVVLLNDDYTTMAFVIEVLESVFQKSPAEAYRIMMHRNQGRGGPDPGARSGVSVEGCCGRSLKLTI